jgi:hypothetical protein
MRIYFLRIKYIGIHKELLDQLLTIIYMIGILLLVLPAFLRSNSKLKQLLTNLTIWIIIVLIVLTFIYIFKN